MLALELPRFQRFLRCSLLPRLALLAQLAVPGLAAATAGEATLVVEVATAREVPAAEAVVFAVPEGGSTAAPRRESVMDQRDRTFVPRILPIQTGTPVRFPNSDNVRHQVYSFSPAKRFQLPLYEGTPARPVVFDRPGVVSLGCNIHDKMSAFIVVVDTPFFEVAQAGRATLRLPAGRYDVRVWAPGRHGEPPAQSVVLATGEPKQLEFRLAR